MSTCVKVLQDGYSRWHQKPSSMFANGTCTLVLGSEIKLIVDTLGPFDREKLISLLAENQLSPDDIDIVVATHSHPDHIGNLNLFTSPRVKQHIVGTHVYRRDIYKFSHFQNEEPLHLTKDIEVIATPGHTLSDVSVVVRNVDGLGTVVVAGDLFEKEADLNDDNIWKEAGSENEEQQIANRAKVLAKADYIVPGHGPMFRVLR